MAPRQTMLVKGEDGEMIECEIISAVEVESEFQKSVPILNTKVAALLAFLNLVPGLGTLIASHTLLCGKKCTYSSPIKGYFVGILTTLLQIGLSIVIIGWFWSVWHGIYFVKKSQEAKNTDKWNKSLT